MNIYIIQLAEYDEFFFKFIEWDEINSYSIILGDFNIIELQHYYEIRAQSNLVFRLNRYSLDQRNNINAGNGLLDLVLSSSNWFCEVNCVVNALVAVHHPALLTAIGYL